MDIVWNHLDSRNSWCYNSVNLSAPFPEINGSHLPDHGLDVCSGRKSNLSKTAVN
jgi:hypothetical protein